MHLDILLDFLFICRETDNATAFNKHVLANTQNYWLTPNQIWRTCCYDRSRDVRLREFACSVFHVLSGID